MSESSNELYSPTKIIKFRIDVPDLNADIKMTSNSTQPIDIPIIVTSENETAMRIDSNTANKEQNVIQNELSKFSLERFSNKPWNCINIKDLSIVNPTESQVTFNRNVFKALESLK